MCKFNILYLRNCTQMNLCTVPPIIILINISFYNRTTLFLEQISSTTNLFAACLAKSPAIYFKERLKACLMFLKLENVDDKTLMVSRAMCMYSVRRNMFMRQYDSIVMLK